MKKQEVKDLEAKHKQYWKRREIKQFIILINQ